MLDSRIKQMEAELPVVLKQIEELEERDRVLRERMLANSFSTKLNWSSPFGRAR